MINVTFKRLQMKKEARHLRIICASSLDSLKFMLTDFKRTTKGRVGIPRKLFNRTAIDGCDTNVLTTTQPGTSIERATNGIVESCYFK